MSVPYFLINTVPTVPNKKTPNTFWLAAQNILRVFIYDNGKFAQHAFHFFFSYTAHTPNARQKIPP